MVRREVCRVYASSGRGPFHLYGCVYPRLEILVLDATPGSGPSLTLAQLPHYLPPILAAVVCFLCYYLKILPHHWQHLLVLAPGLAPRFSALRPPVLMVSTYLPSPPRRLPPPFYCLSTLLGLSIGVCVLFPTGWRNDLSRLRQQCHPLVRAPRDSCAIAACCMGAQLSAPEPKPKVQALVSTSCDKGKGTEVIQQERHSLT